MSPTCECRTRLALLLRVLQYLTEYSTGGNIRPLCDICELGQAVDILQTGHFCPSGVVHVGQIPKHPALLYHVQETKSKTLGGCHYGHVESDQFATLSKRIGYGEQRVFYSGAFIVCQT